MARLSGQGRSSGISRPRHTSASLLLLAGSWRSAARLGGARTALEKGYGSAMDGTEKSDGDHRSQPSFPIEFVRTITVDLASGCEG